ncbi:hypothetical protein GN244_ATG20777 [Phytophthora infestans]|uniref:Uncharacterized protein n=1 Tax=Phytophthora infestans TaxID=4787 RepID=A0A833WHG5_PHYIN|nr:hypothetical protein GN244_ATG20777 [Phytophthora infestans]KAF4131314.1 hypothetical protein GN958_ATG19569 [Phytophthora infestans]
MVAKALVYTERNVGSTTELAALAKKLWAEQLTTWLDGGKSVDDAFKLLKLRDDGYLAFTSRKLEVLDDYIAKLNIEKGGQESLLKTLTRGFGGEEKLLSILATAERSPYTHLRATELGNLRKWQHDKVEPSKVMKLLKLDGEVENALKSSQLRRLDEYINEFNSINRNSEVTLLETLTKKYKEADVAKALVFVGKDEKILAERLQKQQLEGWSKSHLSVVDVFMRLGLGNTPTAVISRNVQALDNYITLYNLKNPPAKESVVGVYVKVFGAAELNSMLKRIPRSAKLYGLFRDG